MGRGGDPAAEPAGQPTADLRSNPLFAEVLRDDFRAPEFVSSALARSTANAQAKLGELEGGIRELDDRIAREVTSRQEELVGQAASLRDAEGAVQGIALAAQAVQASVARIRGEIAEPYAAIREKTLHHANLQAAAELLRHMLQSVKLSQRLRAHVGAGPTGCPEALREMGALDLGKAAKLLTDISSVSREADLSGIAAVEAEAPFLEATRQRVRAQAQALLRKGMEAMSQTEVGSALQVFFNLQELGETVEELVQGHVSRLASALPAALDARRLASEAGGGGGGGGLLGAPGGARSTAATGKVQEALWQRLAACLEQLRASALAAWHLQRVLAKKRDPVTHVLFLEALAAQPGARLPLPAFWEGATGALRGALGDAVGPARAGAVREALVHGYPRLAGLLEALLRRLRQDGELKGVRPAASAEEQAALTAAAAACQHLFLAALLGRVTEAVNAAFVGGTRALPTAAELHKCIGRLHEELKGVGDSPALAAAAAGAVGKALRMLAEKVEYMSAAGPDVRVVTGACTSAQLRNLSLCGQLQEVARSIAALLPRLPPPAAAALRGPLEALEAGAVEVVSPLMRAVAEHAEALLLQMHAQSYGGEEPAPDVAQASPCLLELSRHLQHCRVEFLSKFTPAATPANAGTVGAALARRFASRLLVFFVRHAALLRPLGQAGKLRLAKDTAELEEAVGANLWPLDQLGGPQRQLRAFRQLLFLETAAVPEHPLLAELPPAAVLHHLFARAPPGLQAPHARSGTSPEQYSLWLDGHSAAEAVRHIRAALDACAPAAREEPGFDEVYPVMLRLCAPPSGAASASATGAG